MGRAKKWPEGKVTLTLLDAGKDQAADVAAACELIQVEGSAGPRQMNVAELCREALHYLVGHLRSGRYRAPKKPRPGEAKIVEVGRWTEEP